MSKTPTPSMNELHLELKGLVRWKKFATHLRMMEQSDLDKIKKDNHNSAEQRLAVFGTWLHKCTNASWEDVVSALEKINENILAEHLRMKHCPASSFLPPSSHSQSPPFSTSSDHLPSTRSDPSSHSSTRSDPSSHSSTRFDHLSHSSTRSDRHKHSSIKSYRYNHSSTRPNHHSCSRTKSGSSSCSTTRSDPSNHPRTRSDPSSHSSNRSDPLNHSSTRSDCHKHSSIKSYRYNRSITRSDLSTYSLTKSDYSSHSSTRSDPSSHSSTRFDPSNHSSTRFDPSNHSSTRFDPSSHSSTRFDPSRNSSTRFDPSSHSSTRSDPSCHSSTRFNPSCHSSTRFDPSSPSSTRFDLSSHSSTRCDPSIHSPIRYDHHSLDLQPSKLTNCELDTELNTLVQWERFGLHLPGIKVKDLQIIQSDNPTNVVKQKLALFETWLVRYPSASWDDVVLALERIGEIYLAEQIKMKYTCEDRHTIGTEVYTSLSSEEIVFRELSDLHNTFTKLARDFRNGINKLVEPPNEHVLQEIISFIKDLQLYEIEGLNEVKTINGFIDKIRDHYDFLNCDLLQQIATEYLENLLPRIQTYTQNVKKLKHSIPVKCLKCDLQQFVTESNVSRKYMIAIVKLQEVWEKPDIQRLEKLIASLFPGYNPKWFTVKAGSICCMFLIPKSKAKSYISSSSEKLQLMRLTGIFGLQIGITHVIRDDENESFTFDSALLEASQCGNDEAVQFLLYMGVNINHSNSEGKTALMLACEAGHEEVVQTLVSAGASVNDQDSAGQTALMLASGNLVVLYCLLLAKANPDLQRKDGNTALHNACYKGQSTIVRLLLSFSATFVIANIKGDTAFLASIRGNNTEILKLMLNSIPHSPFIVSLGVVYACRLGHSAVFNLFAKQLEYTPQVIDLIISCAEGDVGSAIQHIMEFNIDPNTTLISGITPLMIASSCGHVDVINSLIQAKADVNSKDEDGYTPLAYAITGSKSLTAVQRLLESGANPNILLGGISIIEKAKEETGTEEIVNLLLKYSALQFNNDHEQLAEKIKESINDQIKVKQQTLLQVAEKIETDFPVTGLTKAQNVHELFNKLQPYYSFLSCDILVDITREFIGGEIEKELEGYLVMMRKFQKSVKIKQLKEVMSLVPIQDNTFDTCDVNIKLNGEWEEGTLENLQQLLKHMFHNKQHLLNHMTVDERDSLCITFTIPTSQSDGIADEVKKRKQFIECVGVSRVCVWDVDVSTMEDSKFSFSSGLLKAAETGSNKAVQFLVEIGVNIDDVDSKNYIGKPDKRDTCNSGLTALCLASKGGHSKVVQILLKEGADPKIQTKDGWTALMYASQNGHSKVVQILLKGGADPNIQQDGRTALMIGSHNGHTKVVQMLLKGGADTNIQQEDEWTALMIGSHIGHSKVVQILLKGGADPNIQKENGRTALIYASHNGHFEVVQILLEGGADPNIQKENGWTALMYASQNGHSEAVQILLKGGADPNIQQEDGWTALMYASQNGHSEVVQILLEGGADPDIQKKRGLSALMSASRNGHSEVVQILLEGNADPNIQKKSGLSSLMYASRNSHFKMVKILLKGGSDPNIQKEDGLTALLYACQNGHSKLVQILLKRGADPNIQKEDGSTALMYASQNGHSEVVQILLKGGAGPNIQKADGSTALMYASRNGHSEVVQILLKGGAGPNIQKADGLTALMYASRNGHLEVVQILLNGGADLNIKT